MSKAAPLKLLAAAAAAGAALGAAYYLFTRYGAPTPSPPNILGPFASPHSKLPSPPLRNRYYVCRHGQSTANVDQIVSSSPLVATTHHGLTALGLEQAAAAALDLQQRAGPLPVVIVTSDYLRALETAKVLSQHLRLRESARRIEPRLRERSFGDFEGQPSHESYPKVWADDAVDSSHTNRNVESVDSVLSRATAVIADLEAELDNAVVVLVAHGDVLQVLQTAFALWDPRRHRELPHLDNASLRELHVRFIPASTPLDSEQQE